MKLPRRQFLLAAGGTALPAMPRIAGAQWRAPSASRSPLSNSAGPGILHPCSRRFRAMHDALYIGNDTLVVTKRVRNNILAVVRAAAGGARFEPRRLERILQNSPVVFPVSNRRFRPGRQPTCLGRNNHDEVGREDRCGIHCLCQVDLAGIGHMASAGTGSLPHLAGEMFKDDGGPRLVSCAWQPHGTVLALLTSEPRFIIYRGTATSTPCSDRGPLRHLDFPVPRRKFPEIRI
jgi:hypothetical protein